jgi:hypothetical protein
MKMSNVADRCKLPNGLCKCLTNKLKAAAAVATAKWHTARATKSWNSAFMLHKLCYTYSQLAIIKCKLTVLRHPEGPNCKQLSDVGVQQLVILAKAGPGSSRADTGKHHVCDLRGTGLAELDHGAVRGVALTADLQQHTEVKR